jgi:hypothetical protein
MGQKTKPRARLPYQHEPRDYQIPFWRAMDNGCKRGLKVWNRRAGKDKTDFNYMVREAFKRPGAYYYMLPQFNQARKAIWDAIDGLTGLKFTDHVPPALVKKINQTEMKITMHTKEEGKESIIQLVGSDNYNALMGTPPVGVVFSEYSLSNPAAWDYIRPILAQNDGWAIFNFTPRGKNHAYDLYKMAKRNPKWFCELLTVDDTKSITYDAIEEERESGMSEDMILQEFYCSFEGAIHGSYYSKAINQSYQDGRICKLPVEPGVTVDTYWDLGMDDSTAIWFIQRTPREYRAIDYYEANGEGLAHYARILQEKARERGFVYGQHTGPHDARVRELGTGVSRLETLENLGINMDIAPELSLLDGIDAVRTVLPKVWFDEERCKQGIRALENYKKKWDEINRTFMNKPVHDWAEHGSSALRYFAVTVKMQEDMALVRARAEEMAEDLPMESKFPVDVVVRGATDFNPHDY